MEKAPAFDKKNLPNMADTHWGEGVFKHYGVSGYEPWGLMGYGNGYGYGYGGYYPAHRGPGREDPYKESFNPNTMKTISGRVIKVDQVPQPGFGTEMRLTVFTDKKEILPVYLGPAFYIAGPWQGKHFKLGDKVAVTGSQVTVRGEPFMLATTVKRGNEVLLLRDKDGAPEWLGWKNE
jgi:hypothetical protein